ncbi:MAG: hydroxyisourate hydrolase [Pseudomonadota bacterium]
MGEPQGYVTTHVLDLAAGRPAAGLKIEAFALRGDDRTPVGGLTTNTDGRGDGPLIPQGALTAGEYEFLFHAGAYLDRAHGPTPPPRFVDLVPIRFGVADAHQHYHVPLLLSPFGYSTYRGS